MATHFRWNFIASNAVSGSLYTSMVCPQVSDSLQPPKQEAALLSEADGLLLHQRRLLPAPLALLVPREPQQHQHTLGAHPLAQRSRSEQLNMHKNQTLFNMCFTLTYILCLWQICQYQTVLVTVVVQTF